MLNLNISKYHDIFSIYFFSKFDSFFGFARKNTIMCFYFVHKNWNAYKQFVMEFRRPCSYAGFRRAIWKMKDDGFLIALPKAAPKDKRDELFGTTYYRLSPRAREMV